MITIQLTPVKYEALVMILESYQKEAQGRFSIIESTCKDLLNEISPDGDKSKNVLEKS